MMKMKNICSSCKCFIKKDNFLPFVDGHKNMSTEYNDIFILHLKSCMFKGCNNKMFYLTSKNKKDYCMHTFSYLCRLGNVLLNNSLFEYVILNLKYMKVENKAMIDFLKDLDWVFVLVTKVERLANGFSFKAFLLNSELTWVWACYPFYFVLKKDDKLFMF